MAGGTVTILSAYHSQNAEGKISEAVQVRAEEIAAAVSQGKMSVTELSAAASELAAFTSISDKAKAVGDMASTARATNTMDAAKRIASTFGQNNGTEASGQTTVAEPASSEGKITADRKIAKDLLEELDRADNISYSKGIVDNLRAMAENKQEEGLQRVIVRGMAGDLKKADDIGYSKYVVDAFEGIAAKTTFANIQVMIVESIMGDVSRADDVSYSKKAVDPVERIARRSASQEVKDLAISSMMDEVKCLKAPRIIRLGLSSLCSHSRARQ